MLIVCSKNGVPVRLTIERWQHIMNRHPEMAEQRERVLETVTEPELIQQGDCGEVLAIRFYPQTPWTSNYLLVVCREASLHDGFVLIAYFTSRPSGQRVALWKR